MASILRNRLRALNVGLGFWCWFFFCLISKENLCFYLSDLRNKTQLMFLASACLGSAAGVGVGLQEGGGEEGGCHHVPPPSLAQVTPVKARTREMCRMPLLMGEFQSQRTLCWGGIKPGEDHGLIPSLAPQWVENVLPAWGSRALS